MDVFHLGVEVREVGDSVNGGMQGQRRTNFGDVNEKGRPTR